VRDNRNDRSSVDRIETVTADLHTLVGELLRVGIGTKKALLEVARRLGIGKCRVQHIYYQNQPTLVDATQQRSFAKGAVALLDHLAAEHMKAAMRCQDKAEQIRDRQRQLELPLINTERETDRCQHGLPPCGQRLAA